jgi:hypothetical protein
MALNVATMVFYVLLSLLITIMGFFVAKYVDNHPPKNERSKKRWEQSASFRMFLIKYPWLVFLLMLFVSYLVETL